MRLSGAESFLSKQEKSREDVIMQRKIQTEQPSVEKSMASDSQVIKTQMNT